MKGREDDESGREMKTKAAMDRSNSSSTEAMGFAGIRVLFRDDFYFR